MRLPLFFIVLKTVGHERAIVSLHKIIILEIPIDNFMSMWFHGQDIIKPEYGDYLFGQTET